jgi:hypothetical protein
MYTLLNPHISDFIAEPLAFKYVKRRALKKYSFLIESALEEWGEINILVNFGASGLLPMGIYTKLPFFAKKIFTKWEIKSWKKLNGFGPEIKINFDTKNINDKKHLVLLAYKNYINPKPLLQSASEFENTIVHLSHYHSDCKTAANTLQKIPNVFLAADADVSEAPLFKACYPWYKKQIIPLRFFVAPRFVKNKKIVERKNPSVATGTFHYVKEIVEDGSNLRFKEFFEIVRANALHPLRRQLFENKEENKHYIDCLCSPYLEPQKNLLKAVLPAQFKSSQKKYFAIDIVEKYNNHKFAIVGEELLSGLPGVGAFEAMACGAVLIADETCYNGMGLVPYKHYLPHNGTIKNIIYVIETYIQKNIELEQISENGRNWVLKNMTIQNVFKTFCSELNQIKK